MRRLAYLFERFPAFTKTFCAREVAEIYRTPLPSLVYWAQTVHRQFHPEDRVQTCQLLSIKTGGCPEDCGYCPQSAHYDAGIGREGLLDPEHVISVARDAAGRGVTRFCMGAAWRQAPEGREFQKVLQMVRGVSELGLEVCCTLGMLTERQAEQLKDAGLSAYNHNLDTSPEFYGSIITTRVYDDRLKTLATQSASTTFTGDRTVLNKEFKIAIPQQVNQYGTYTMSRGPSRDVR